MPTGAEVPILLAAVIGSESMTAAGMWLWFRVKRLERDNADLLAMTKQLEGVSGQLGEVREQVAAV